MALDDGTIYPADIVVMAVGIRPETRVATAAGLYVERGIVVNDRMVTADPDISRWASASNTNGLSTASSRRSTTWPRWRPGRWRELQAAFRPVAVGDSAQGDRSAHSIRRATSPPPKDREEIVLRDVSSGVYKRLVLKDDKLIGAILYGDTVDGSWFFDMRQGRRRYAAYPQHDDFGRGPWRGTTSGALRRSLQPRRMIVSSSHNGPHHLSLLRSWVRGSGDAASRMVPCGSPATPITPPTTGGSARRARRSARPCPADGRLLYPEIARRAHKLGCGTRHGCPKPSAPPLPSTGRTRWPIYGSGQLLTEDYYVANKLMKGFIGAANIDTNSRLCMASSVAGPGAPSDRTPCRATTKIWN